MSVRVLHRLTGQETEYVARFHPDSADAKRPLTFHLLLQLVEELKRRLPLVPADYPKKGFFLATGGAVWQERPGEGVDHPLIEGSTPECRGALQLLIYQRAQDHLLASAAQDVAGGDFILCKSDCDAIGNVYGTQENYEAILADGWRLTVWRIAVVGLLAPLMVLGWICLMPLMLGLLVYYAGAGVLYLLFLAIVAPLNAKSWARFGPTVRVQLFGPWGGEPLRFMPKWVAVIVTVAEHVALAPAALAVWSVCSLLAFRDARRVLLPFLISRAVVAGSGRLCADGAFHVASKASGFRLISGTGLFRIRSIFSFGPQFKSLTFLSLVEGLKFPCLLAQRQRLQISLGDGNLCEEAEYLRIGTTMLVLDAIEAAHSFRVPHVTQPLAALRAIASDPTLGVRVQTRDGRSLTALEIQRIYLNACRDFVASLPEAPVEANEILRRWAGVLDDLETAPQHLIGHLDWVTKRWLIETAGNGASWATRKKIDLRYHELSPNGYFERLRSTGMIHTILCDSQIEAAACAPPPDSPATGRGQCIRRLASSDQPVQANWQRITVGKPPKLLCLCHQSVPLDDI